MKKVRFVFAVLCALVATTTFAQDFSDPKWAKWGATPEERQTNILNSNFLKESCDNRNYNQAAAYLQKLLQSCPKASASIYQRGAVIYKNKINRAKTLEEKKMFVDSLLLLYDLRLEHFGHSARYGKGYILDRKAKEVATYMANDRAAVRKAFREAIEANGDDCDGETVALYFANLCEDYKNTDEVLPDEIIAEYDRLLPLVSDPDEKEYKDQLDAAFGLSGAASCENLEKLFTARLANTPNDVDVLAQAVGLMSRAKCESEFYFQISEKYYEVKPSSETALFLAQAFQNKGDYDRATKYLNEALATETDPAEQQKLYIRMALVELVSNDINDAAAAARKARDLNAEDGVPYFILAQCYAASAVRCSGFDAQATFWAAYDTMSKALSLLGEDSDYYSQAKESLSAYRYRFPSSEECFFQELKAGESFTIRCGTAAGIQTTVRMR